MQKLKSHFKIQNFFKFLKSPRPKASAVKFFLLALLAFSFLLLAKSASAQDPVPDPYVPCDQVRPDAWPPSNWLDSEYHSLRPYQASPCNPEVEDDALYCGNDLVLQHEIEGKKGLFQDCPDNGDGTETCNFREKIKKNLSIDLSGADLPIMGNTEDVINSQDQPDPEPLLDSDKVNEYVSWYLNGVINRAEYPYLSLDDEADIKKLINFSGPLNKLLPWEIQALSRMTTIEKAFDKKDLNKDGVAESLQRHDQIVACIFFGIPVPCHKGFFSFLNKELRLSFWKNHLPPLPSDDKYQGEDFQKYWKDYLRWRGKRCTPDFTIPIINKKIYLCWDDITKPNYWSNLFPYIPYSSTEDRKGEADIDKVDITPVDGDVKISDPSITSKKPAELFFSHMVEASEMTELLQSTFVAKDNRNKNKVSALPSETCNKLNVRSNDGDDLFAGEIKVAVSYTAEFSCVFDLPGSPKPPPENSTCYNMFPGLNKCAPKNWNCSPEFGQSGCPNSHPICGQNCKPPEPEPCIKNIGVKLSTITKTPLADDVWARTVAGESSVFKRIFPKVGPDGAIVSLMDIPAATKITYKFGGNISTTGTELLFPHIGGVYEYFLKGIQTILRPKGYGEQVISGQASPLPGEVNCDKSAPEVSLANTLDKQQTYQLALSWVAGQPGNKVLECYNDVVKRSRENSINPAFSLWLWLHESNASNYAISQEDFGVHYGAPKGFVDQINGYLQRAKSYTANHPLCQASGVTDNLEAFMYIYRSGTCDPNNNDARDFYNEIINQWNWISSCPIPRGPTDTNCP